MLTREQIQKAETDMARSLLNDMGYLEAGALARDWPMDGEGHEKAILEMRTLNEKVCAALENLNVLQTIGVCRFLIPANSLLVKAKEIDSGLPKISEPDRFEKMIEMRSLLVMARALNEAGGRVLGVP